MRKGKFTKSQMADILAEADAGAETAELCKKYGIRPHTIYSWRARYGGSFETQKKQTTTAQTQPQQKEESCTRCSRLSRIIADQMLELQELKNN